MITVKLTAAQVAELIYGADVRQQQLRNSRAVCFGLNDNDGAEMCKQAIKTLDEAVEALVAGALKGE